ncbi:MAG: ATP-binding protein, partial [Gammaproteobacteria bacterium]
MIQRLLKKLISGCSFRRQLSVAFTIGILILALVSSVATSWLGHERAKANLIEHGKQISQNLARQSILALLYAEGENAREAAQGALEFPDVRYVAIYDMHDHALLEQGDTDVSRKNFTLPEINDSNVVEEKANYWRIANYVYTDAVAAEEDFLLADAPHQQRLGRVELIISKDTLHKAMVGGFIVNISISLALALLLLAVLQFFTRQLTHPLYNLSDIMKKAKQGQTNVQALLEGPKEISTMALAFNNMMAVLEQRDQQLRDQNEQLEQRVANRTAELALARDDALRASQAKSQFLATMSHEIRTPMNGVLGMLQLLGKTELNTRQQHYVGTASDSGEMLLTVINDILDFSKLEAGKLELEAIPFDPVKLVEDTATLMAKSAYEKGVELLCSIGPDMPSLVKGDPTRLRQVLTNLVNNAIKFTDQGDIVLYAEILEEDLIHFGVRDTGIGIAEEAQQQLFEAFTQADSSHTRKYGGTGLGLAICQRLVQAMGGHLEVASAPGLGSNFGFDLPLKQVPLEDNQAQQYQQLAG